VGSIQENLPIRTRTIIALVVLAFLIPRAWSQPPLADKLPEGTLAYLGWAGRSLTFDGSRVGQLLREPEVASLVRAAKAALLSAVGPGENRQAVELFWQMAGVAWQHPIAVGLFGLSVKEPSAIGRPDGGPMPVGVVLIDLGKDRAAFADQLQKLLNLARDLRVSQAAAGNVRYQAFETPAGPCGVGFVGDLFFATVGEKVPEIVVAIAGGKGEPLSANPNFVSAMKEVSGEHVQLAFYLDVQRFYEVLEKIASGEGPLAGSGEPGKVGHIVKALGISQVSALAAAASIEDRGIHERLRIFSPAPHKGVLAALAGKPLSDRALASVPADADVLATVNLDPSKMLAEIKRVAAEIEPKSAGEIDEVLAMVSKEVGLDVEKDLLAHVGDQWMLVSAPSLGGFLTGTVLTVELKDAAKFEHSLGKLEARFGQMLGEQPAPTEKKAPATQPRPASRPRRRGPEIRSYQANAVKVRYLALSGRGAPVWLGVVTPAWAVHAGRLYVGPYPQVVAAAAAGPAEKTLPQSEKFAALRKRVAASASGLVYVNTPGLCRRLYGVPMAAWSLACNVIGARTGLELRPEMLPALPKLEKFLSPDIWALSSDAKGITIESYGSGLTGGVLGGGRGLAPLGWFFSLASGRRMTAEASAAHVSLHNLHSVGCGCELYRAEHGSFPPDLVKLVEARLVPAGVLTRGKAGPRLDGEGKPIGPFDYAYLGGNMPPKPPPDLILAHERPELARHGRINVLYTDGHVRSLSMRQFQQELSKTEKGLKEQGQ